MDSIIRKREIPILRCTSTIMQIFHDNMLEAYYENKLNDMVALEAFSRTDTMRYGFADVDVAGEFEGQPKSLAIFIWLVEKAIQKAQKNGEYNPDVYPLLYNFKDELIEYLQELLRENKGKITFDAIEEELTILACKEQKLLKGLWRDSFYIADFINIKFELWDIKIPISKNKKNKHIFSAQKVVDFLKERHISGYSSIVDITKLEDIDAQVLVKVLGEEFNRRSFNTIVIVHRENPSKSRKLERTNIIRLQGQPITTCSDLTLKTFYESLLTVVEQTEHKENPKIMKLIKNLNQTDIHLGCVDIDIANYGFNKEEVSALSSLMTSAFERIRDRQIIRDFFSINIGDLERSLNEYGQLLPDKVS